MMKSFTLNICLEHKKMTLFAPKMYNYINKLKIVSEICSEILSLEKYCFIIKQK